ncbi:MAG: DUF4870 domain-containing protein [Alphaproteobacteria bacterium]|nr:DUF4870 domain-containing protein [Alphaproteobacteria bacterium]MCB9691086.1 DUF4870 domain-containing protein [Alphaproteobacteria bacterium]
MPPLHRPPPGPPPIRPRMAGDTSTRGMPTDDGMLWALLAHASPILTSFVGPLCIWLVKRRSDEFAAYHAAQAFWYAWITLLVISLSCGMGGLLLPFFWLYGLYVGLRAREGEWSGYPFISGFGFNGKLV